MTVKEITPKAVYVNTSKADGTPYKTGEYQVVLLSETGTKAYCYVRNSAPQEWHVMKTWTGGQTYTVELEQDEKFLNFKPVLNEATQAPQNVTNAQTDNAPSSAPNTLKMANIASEDKVVELLQKNVELLETINGSLIFIANTLRSMNKQAMSSELDNLELED